MDYHFDIKDAQKYGTDAAVIINNFRYWIKFNRANKKHFYEGRTWVYYTVGALKELFPWLSTDKISRTLRKLCDDGVLIKGHFSDNKYDRTTWYAFCDEESFVGLVVADLADSPNASGNGAKSTWRNRQMEDANSPNVYRTDNKPDNKPDKKTKGDPRADALVLFDEFCRAHPKGSAGKHEAQGVWLNLKPEAADEVGSLNELYQKIIIALKCQVHERAQLRAQTGYADSLKNMPSYLRKKQWRDNVLTDAEIALKAKKEGKGQMPSNSRVINEPPKMQFYERKEKSERASPVAVENVLTGLRKKGLNIKVGGQNAS
jgi:hypothetical protein